jgi:hypothetical protein
VFRISDSGCYNWSGTHSSISVIASDENQNDLFILSKQEYERR